MPRIGLDGGVARDGVRMGKPGWLMTGVRAGPGRMFATSPRFGLPRPWGGRAGDWLVMASGVGYGGEDDKGEPEVSV